MKKKKRSPDYSVSKTDDENEDSGQRSFKCGEQLGKYHSTLNCCSGIKVAIWYSKEQITTKLGHQPTVVAFVADALVFRVKYSLFQHAQYNDGADPELDPQQIPPIASAPEEPESPKEHVHDAHDHEELWQTREQGRWNLVTIRFPRHLQHKPSSEASLPEKSSRAVPSSQPSLERKKKGSRWRCQLFTKLWKETSLTREGEAELLCADVFVFHSAEQRLHLHDEQIRAVLPSFGHCADVLQGRRGLIYSTGRATAASSVNCAEKFDHWIPTHWLVRPDQALVRRFALNRRDEEQRVWVRQDWLSQWSIVYLWAGEGLIRIEVRVVHLSERTERRFGGYWRLFGWYRPHGNVSQTFGKKRDEQLSKYMKPWL